LRLSNGLLASGFNDNSIKIWNPYDGSLQSTLVGHSSWILSLVQINDETFASGSDDSSIRIWNTETGELKQILKAYGPVYTLTILSNGDLISGTTSGFVEFWDTNNLLRTKYFTQGGRFIYSLVSLENGDFVVGFSGGDYEIYRSDLNIIPLTIYSTCKLNIFIFN
jgi:WD40 repeat protein